jgi:hypothetical protein
MYYSDDGKWRYDMFDAPPKNVLLGRHIAWRKIIENKINNYLKDNPQGIRKSLKEILKKKKIKFGSSELSVEIHFLKHNNLLS